MAKESYNLVFKKTFYSNIYKLNEFKSKTFRLYLVFISLKYKGTNEVNLKIVHIIR